MSLNNITICEPIKPKDVSIFIEDGVPYIKYTGTTTLSNGIKVEVEIPKMDLWLKGIECYHEDISDCINRPDKKKYMRCKKELFAVEDVGFTVKTLERTCKKEELERELGYKLNLK